MICKWCGNSMSPSETKCKRCGKENPALSDCGGFYDLAPRARTPITEASPAPANNAAYTQQTQPARVPVPAKKAKTNKLLLILTALTFAVFVALLVLIFVLFGKVKTFSEEVKGLQKNMSTVYEVLGIDENEDDAENEDKDKEKDKNKNEDKDKNKAGGSVAQIPSTTKPPKNNLPSEKDDKTTQPTEPTAAAATQPTEAPSAGDGITTTEAPGIGGGFGVS